jgi:hypothetical protein
MAENNKTTGTVYQNLNKMLNLDGLGFENNTPTNQNKSKIIIKGNSPEDVRRKGLELQQKKDLEQKFFRTTDRGFQKALQYEAARLPAYLDYEGMEYYPIIASALDLFMEEATTIGTNGKMLNIYSNKERIKFHLEELFNDVINVNVNLPFWTRNTCKYGDNFVLLYGVKKKGITHVKQMVNYEVERIERVHEGKPTVKFKERLTGDDFNVFEIAHFRLLGDDKYLPYGSSILNKVRRVFRQLVLAEDAMLTYRILRAGEKKVFKIDVGNIDEDDIEEYIFKVATKFKKSTNVYPDSGQIDYRFNILGNDEDYFLPVRNANVQTGIETLPGAQNLDQIHDIEYLRDNLFTGLGVPKPFLSFQDAAGAGKSMAQYDIRFAKKVNRVQQAMIQELNKIAVIHLYLLGFEKEDLANFTLTLTNPSTQLELLKSELFRDKAQTYAELTRNEGGIAAMSHTDAKRLLFNMSDREIISDYKKQRMERALAQELTDTPLIIKRTTLFDDIDKKYGDEAAVAGIEAGTGTTSGGGAPAGGGAPDMGGGGAPEMGGGGGAPEMGGEIEPTGAFPTPAALPPPTGESVEKRKTMTDKKFDDLLNELVTGTDNKPEVKKSSDNKQLIKEVDDKNTIMNQAAFDMISEIDALLDNSDTINLTEIEDIDLNTDKK